MRQLYILFFGLVFIVSVGAQDYGVSIKLPIAFQQYHLNPHIMNPALAGFHDQYRIGIHYRNQWSDFPGAPKSFAAIYNGPATDRVGLGAAVFGESFGVVRQFRGQLAYAYKFGTEDYDMSLGLSTDYSRFGLNNQAITDPLYEPGDEVVLNALDGRQFFSASIGFFTKYKEQFYFGLSLPQVIFTRLNDNAGDEAGDGETQINYIAMLGTWIKVPDYNMNVEPSVYLKKVGNVPLHVDINLMADFLDEKLFGGLFYSVGAGSKFGFLIGARINSLRIYYGYDVSYQEFQEYNNGAHEVTLNFDLFSQFLKEKREKEKMEK